MVRGLLFIAIIATALFVTQAQAQEVNEERVLSIVERILDLFAGFFERIIEAIVDGIKSIFVDGNGSDGAGHQWNPRSTPPPENQNDSDLIGTAVDLLNRLN